MPHCPSSQVYGSIWSQRMAVANANRIDELEKRIAELVEALGKQNGNSSKKV